MRLLFSIWWLLMACFLLICTQFNFADPGRWDSWVPRQYIVGFAGVLIITALGYFVFAQWSLHSSIFETKFERTLDVIRSQPLVTTLCPNLVRKFDDCLTGLFGDGGLSRDGSRLIHTSVTNGALSVENRKDGRLLWDARLVIIQKEDSQHEPFELRSWPEVRSDERYF